MGYNWKNLKIPRFYGLDLKTNVLDVKDGYSLDCENVYQDQNGVISKRPGNEVMFDSDETASVEIDELGSATLSGTKYYFKFAGGSFKHSLSRTGALTSITPSPAISTTNQIWWAVLDDKLFFVDGTNVLRFFDPAAPSASIYESSVHERPTASGTTFTGFGGFDFIYTVERAYYTAAATTSQVTTAESPGSPLAPGASGDTLTVPQNIYGAVNIALNDRIRVYSRSNTVLGAYKNVTLTSGSTPFGVYELDAAGGGYFRVTVTNATYAVGSSVIRDSQPNLYSDLGVALNKSAPSAITGLTVHYGRLVGWKDDSVYNSKSSNPHSWPSDTAQHEAFVYTVGEGDGENFQRCLSFQESLYCFKKSNVFVFGGVGPDDTGNNAYSFRRLETNGIGLVAPKSAVVVGEEKSNAILWLSSQGFYASDGSMPVRIGERIEPLVLGFSETQMSGAVAVHDKLGGAYLCFVGPSNNRVGFYFDTRKDQGEYSGWFKFGQLPVKSLYWDSDRYLFGAYTGYCGSERSAGTALDYSDIKIEYVAPGAINTATEEITVTQSYATGDTVVIRTNGTIPAGLTANTTYYAINVSSTVIKLATSAANALAGTAINITSQGAGTHSIVGSKAIAGYYTTNWIHFGSTSVVKKLGKPQLIFDATADSISLTMTFAYDWVTNFQDQVSISVTSSHSWGAGAWGSFAWAAGANAVPKNIAAARRKVRSLRYKLLNSIINQDFNFQAIEIPYDGIRNRDNFAS